ncbi:hypothetical protein LQZ18_04040 [Lachnospiraceae bacterium ZAX-1]
MNNIYDCIKDENGNFFDLVLINGEPIISDYSQLEKNLIVSKEHIITVGGEKEKIEIKSISDLQKALAHLIISVHTSICNTKIHIRSESDNSLINTASMEMRFEFPSFPPIDDNLVFQLVFDILYDKYLIELPRITLNKYCNKYINYEWDTSKDLSGDNLAKAKNAAHKMMVEQIKRTANIYNNDSQRADLTKLGVNPDQYLEDLDSRNTVDKSKPVYYQSEQRKSKHDWDYIYYNADHRLITYRQYKRKFERDSNYLYNDFIRNFCNYDSFVQTFIPKDNYTDYDYFYKSMGFYDLEIYKRLDFIYKLAVRMESKNFPSIDKEFFSVKRFHPIVACPCIYNNSLCVYTKNKYYKPLLLIEDLWQQRLENIIYEDSNKISLNFFDYYYPLYLIRAKTYELFNYHYKFISNDYDDISTFIHKHYDILSYHEPKKKWFEIEGTTTHYFKTRIKNAETINNALFWKSDKRTPVEWVNPSKNN